MMRNNEIETSKRKDIRIVKQSSGTRSATATVVEVYIENETIYVDVSNYTGDVFVQAYGNGQMLQTVFASSDNSSGALDISSLPSGNYTLQITLNSTYTGTFCVD